MHPSEDDLIDALMGDADADGRARLEAHVHTCDDCRRAFEDLAAALTMVSETVPEPPAGFERVMWARVSSAIALEPSPGRMSWRQWVPAGVLAASVLAGAGIAGMTSGRMAPAVETAVVATGTPVTGASQAELNEAVLYTALNEHLQKTAALLIELRNAPDRAALAVERVMADDLIAAGRLYRSTAEYTGNYMFVNVLDDLETVLVELARSPERIDPQSRQWLRTRIEEDSLLFKVRAVSNDLRERVANPVD
jgi:anti-sigma factor RsiW